MIENQELIGKASMELLDNIEKEYGDEDKGTTVRSILCAAEISYIDEEGARSTHIALEYSGRPIERAGLWLYLGQALGVKG